MKKKIIAWALISSFSMQQLHALDTDFIALLAGQHNAGSYEKPENVAEPVYVDLQGATSMLIKQADELEPHARYAVKNLLLQIEQLDKKSLDSASRWLSSVTEKARMISLPAHMRTNLEYVIALSMSAYLYEKLQRAVFDILQGLDTHIMYWEKQQANPLAHSIHRPLPDWWSKDPRQNAMRQLTLLRQAHTDNCALLGKLANHVKKFDPKASTQEKLSWLAQMFKHLGRNASTAAQSEHSFDQITHMLGNALEYVTGYARNVSLQTAHAQMPSHLGRNWIRYLGASIGAAVGLTYYVANKQKVHSSVDAFYQTFIKSPFNNFWNTIFAYKKEKNQPDTSEHEQELTEGLLGLKTSASNMASDVAREVHKFNDAVKKATSKIPQHNDGLSYDERYQAHKEAANPVRAKLVERYKQEASAFANFHNELKIGNPIDLSEIDRKANALDINYLSDLLTIWSDDLTHEELSSENGRYRVTNWLYNKVINPIGYKKNEIPFVLNALNLFKEIGLYRTERIKSDVGYGLDVMSEDGTKTLDELQEAFDTCAQKNAEAMDKMGEGIAGLSECMEKRMNVVDNMLDATRNVIAVAAVLPTMAASALGIKKLWGWTKGLLYRSPDYETMRRALNDTFHILIAYEYGQLDQMRDKDRGRLLYDTFQLKKQAALLNEPERHQFQLETARLESTNLNSEKKLRIVDQMYRNYEFLAPTVK